MLPERHLVSRERVKEGCACILTQRSRDSVYGWGVAIWNLAIPDESEQVWALMPLLHDLFPPTAGAGAQTELDPK